MFKVLGRVDFKEKSFEFVFFGLDLMFANRLNEGGVVFEWVVCFDDNAWWVGRSDGVGGSLITTVF